MLITVEHAELAKALKLSSTNLTKTGKVSAEEQAFVDDVYECVLVESMMDGVFISATNGNVWTTARIPAEAKGLGRVMIRSSQISSIVSQLDDREVELEVVGGDQLQMRSGGFRAQFAVRSAMEYPTAPVVEPVASARIPGAALRALVDAVGLCAYDKPDRPALCGVNLEVRDGVLWGVAADGACIAISSAMEALHTGETSKPFSVTLPVLSAVQAGRTGDTEAIDFSISKTGMVSIVSENVTMVCKTVTQPFPDWRSAKNLPNELDPMAWGEFETKALRRAIRRVLSLAGDRKTAPGLQVAFWQGRLALTMQASTKSSSETLDGLKGDMTDNHRMVNGDKLEKILGAVNAKTTRLRIPVNPNHPIGVDPITEIEDIVCPQYWIMPRAR